GVDLYLGPPAERDGVQPVDRPSEVLLHVSVHPLDDGDDRHEEHDADDHADHGEEALELLRPDLLEREPYPFAEEHRQTTAASRTTSLSITPSRSVTTRCAWAAMSFSWVTRMIVCP